MIYIIQRTIKHSLTLSRIVKCLPYVVRIYVVQFRKILPPNWNGSIRSNLIRVESTDSPQNSFSTFGPFNRMDGKTNLEMS